MVASVAALRQPTSLPTVLTPVVGRNADLDWVLATIDEPSNHMITLTDPGGSASARGSVALPTSTKSPISWSGILLDIGGSFQYSRASVLQLREVGIYV